MTLISVFNHLAQLPSRFCQIPISPSRVGQTKEHSKSKSTKPRPSSLGTPCISYEKLHIKYPLVIRHLNVEYCFWIIFLALNRCSPHITFPIKDCVDRQYGCIRILVLCSFDHIPCPPKTVETGYKVTAYKAKSDIKLSFRSPKVTF